MTWWIHATNKESKSLVIHKTRQKPYLERKLSNHLSSLLFHSKVSSSLLFHSKLPLFYSKLAFFYWNCQAVLFHFFKTVKFATSSLKTIKFATFIRNCFHTKLFHTKIFLFEIVEFATFFNLKVVKNIQFLKNNHFFIQNGLEKCFLNKNC